MLIVHGELERVQQDRSDEFLKQLNVYHEITNIKQRLDDNKYQILELNPLLSSDETLSKNQL